MDGLIEREWRTISQNSNYEVSNYGEIRNKKRGKMLIPYINSCGYPQIKIAVARGVWKKLTVHRLVAQAFIPNPLSKPYVNHKDYNRANNRVDNLEWVTPSENNLWSGEHMSKARLGHKRSAEAIRKAREANLGSKRSNEQKRKMSEAQLAMRTSPYPPHISRAKKGLDIF